MAVPIALRQGCGQATLLQRDPAGEEPDIPREADPPVPAAGDGGLAGAAPAHPPLLGGGESRTPILWPSARPAAIQADTDTLGLELGPLWGAYPSPERRIRGGNPVGSLGALSVHVTGAAFQPMNNALRRLRYGEPSGSLYHPFTCALHEVPLARVRLCIFGAFFAPLGAPPPSPPPAVLRL